MLVSLRHSDGLVDLDLVDVANRVEIDLAILADLHEAALAVRSPDRAGLGEASISTELARILLVLIPKNARVQVAEVVVKNLLLSDFTMALNEVDDAVSVSLLVLVFNRCSNVLVRLLRHFLFS